MIDKELKGLIAFQEAMLQTAKELGAISNIVLTEKTIKYLKELRVIKEKEE